MFEFFGKFNFKKQKVNVYVSSRRRKLKLFQDYKRKAVVLVPNDELYKERLSLAEKEDGKEISINLINDMKST